MITLNLGVRFLLEIVAIASLAYWGYRLPSATATKIAISVIAPLLLIVVWAFVVAPGADNPLSQTTRMLIGSLLLLFSSAALATTGHTRPAIVIAVVIVLNTILMLAFPDNPGS